MSIDVAKSAEHVGLLRKMSAHEGRRELCRVMALGGVGALLSACGSGVALPVPGVSVI